MILKKIYIALFLLAGFSEIWCQQDEEPPDSPLLMRVTVQPETGFTEIYWNRSKAEDVAGYIIYRLIGGAVIAINTIWNPLSTSYIDIDSKALYWSESYFVASRDTAGNLSPLSNDLSTVFTMASVDTCRSTINITWNQYKSSPLKVNGYRILVSENNSSFSEVAVVQPDKSSYMLGGIRSGTNYCIVVEAVLENGTKSSSNKSCVYVKMQKAPEWINADYATVDNNGKIALSFTIDPASEIKKFRLERKQAGDTGFLPLETFTIPGNTLKYTDNSSNITKFFVYRLAAINNCGFDAVYSNVATNIVLRINFTGEIIKLSWNNYSDWRGGIAEQTVMADYGNGFSEYVVLPPADTLLQIRYSGIMYHISGPEVCFYIRADENINSLGIAGSSKSNIVCLQAAEKVYVPNTFTPDKDNINDFFKPVISFVPRSYQLIITDRNNNIVFESTDYEATWNGTKNGNPLPSGVYLWYLRLVSPSGEKIQKSGIVNIIRNR